MVKKRGLFKNYYNVKRLSRWVSWIRVGILCLFLLIGLFFEWQILHYNIYFTVLLASYLFENMVFALVSVPEKIFDNNKKRHLLLASVPVNIWLIALMAFWPITIILIKLSIGNFIKILLAFVAAKLMVNSAVGLSNHYVEKILMPEQE